MLRHSRLRHVYFLLGSILLTLIVIYFISISPLLTLSQSALIAWVGCAALYCIATISDARNADNTWSSYRNLAVMTILLLEGYLAALVLIVVSISVSALIRVRWGARMGMTDMPINMILWRRMLICAVSVLALSAATLLYRLFQGPIPLNGITSEYLLALFFALFGHFGSIQLARYLIARRRGREFEPIWGEHERPRLYSEMTMAAVMVAMPLIYHGSGISAFCIVLIMVAAYALRYHEMSEAGMRVNQMYQQSLEVVRKLTLVNRAAQKAMFNVDQQIAIENACQTAHTIAHADYALVLLATYEGAPLHVVQSVGLNIMQEDMLAERTFSLVEDSSTRIVADKRQSHPPGSLTGLAELLEAQSWVEIPLRSGSSAIGYLAVYYHQPQSLSATETELLEILSLQLASALDNAQLLHEMEIHAFEMTHLVHLSRISASSLDLTKVSVDIAGVLRQMTNADWVMIGLFSSNANYIRIAGLSTNQSSTDNDTVETRLPIFADLSRVNRETGMMVFTVDDPANPLSNAMSSYLEKLGLQTLAVVPLASEDDHLFGLLFIGRVQIYRFSDRETQLLETAAYQIAAQIHNVRTYADTYHALRQQLQQLSLIEDIAGRISSSHDFHSIIRDVFDAALKSTQADVMDLALLTDAGDFWVIEHVFESGTSRRLYMQQRIDEGVMGMVARSGEVVVARDNRTLSQYVSTVRDRYMSSLAVPIKRNGQIVGVLNVESKQLDFFNQDQAHFLMSLGNHAIISIENARLLEELRYQIDTLTNLRELSLSLSTAVDIDAVAGAVMSAAMHIAQAQYAAVFQWEPSENTLIPLSKRQVDQRLEMNGQMALILDLARQSIYGADPLMVEDVRERYGERVPQPVNYSGLIAVPVRNREYLFGVLCLGFSEHALPDQRDLNTLMLLAVQAARHLENAALNEQIHEGNNRMRAILDSTRDGVILLDYNGRLIEVNPAAQRLMGINLSEYIGEPLVDILMRHSDSETGVKAGYSQDELIALARIQRLQPQGITRREFSRQVASNQMIYVEEIGSPVMDEHNHVVGRLMALRDITEEKMVENYREEITGMAVHDLRSPLASIINALKLALENIDRPNGTMIATQTINRAQGRAEELMNLVNSLLDIRKGKQMTLERAETTLEDLVEMARLTLLASAEKAGIAIEVRLEPNLPQVRVDVDKIRRVIINLLDNALRYSPAGKSVLVAARYDVHRGKVLVEVADSGPGIPEGERERIFEQYWQVKENKPLRGTKGSGIGLTFCQRVLEAHGERIWVEAEGPLPGACFAFTLSPT